MSLQYVDRIIHDSQGHTSNNYYYRFVRKADGKIWDAVNEVLVDDPNWADAAIVLVEVGTQGVYKVIIPAALPRGQYDVVIYLRSGSVAQNTDDIELQYDTTAGSIFGF